MRLQDFLPHNTSHPFPPSLMSTLRGARQQKDKKEKKENAKRQKGKKGECKTKIFHYRMRLKDFLPHNSHPSLLLQTPLKRPVEKSETNETFSATQQQPPFSPPLAPRTLLLSCQHCPNCKMYLPTQQPICLKFQIFV